MSQPRSDPSFDIPQRPERRYSRSKGLEYNGGTVFTLTPDPALENGDARLCALVERVLEGEPYRYGDWFDLPMPLFLVHDRETGDVFRVAIRDGNVEFHVLPGTEAAGLRALYRRLCEATAVSVGAETQADDGLAWHVDCRTDTDG